MLALPQKRNLALTIIIAINLLSTLCMNNSTSCRTACLIYEFLHFCSFLRTLRTAFPAYPSASMTKQIRNASGIHTHSDRNNFWKNRHGSNSFHSAFPVVPMSSVLVVFEKLANYKPIFRVRISCFPHHHHRVARREHQSFSRRPVTRVRLIETDFLGQIS